ncbi:MAG: peptidase M10 [Ferruginibacter sp.]
MGEVELLPGRKLLIIHAVIIIYGDAANEDIALAIAKDIQRFWNDAEGKVAIRDGWFSKKVYDVRFSIMGKHDPELVPQTVFENTDPRNNYFRVEEFAQGDISFVDAINSNTGYFKLQNILDNSTTAAHEFGHTLGLVHPHDLDIRGKGTPGIMYPRGTLVEPHYQYDPNVTAGEKGGTLNPFTRRVLQKDIDDLRLNDLDFNKEGIAVIGAFSSIWHEKFLPGTD